MVERLDEIDDRTGEHLLSVSLGVEDGVYTQFVGVQVEADAEPPEGMDKLDLPSARWVQFDHHGPVEGIGSSFYTMRQWADQNDHSTEHVFVEFHPLDGDGPVELLVRLDREAQGSAGAEGAEGAETRTEETLSSEDLSSNLEGPEDSSKAHEKS